MGTLQSEIHVQSQTGDVFRKLTIKIASKFWRRQDRSKSCLILVICTRDFCFNTTKAKEAPPQTEKDESPEALWHRCQEGRFLDVWKTMEISFISYRQMPV